MELKNNREYIKDKVYSILDMGRSARSWDNLWVNAMCRMYQYGSDEGLVEVLNHQKYNIVINILEETANESEKDAERQSS